MWSTIVKNILHVSISIGLILGVVVTPANAADDCNPETDPTKCFDEQFYSGNNILFYSPVVPCVTDAASVSASSGSLDSFLKALAKQESGGNPTAANPGSSARGKYQYITSTWNSRATLYPPAGDYSSADKAPEAVQDAVAYIEYAQKWKQFDGSIFKLAVSHFYPAANDDPSLLDQHVGPATNPTPREYADAVVEKVNNGYGSEIPLKYSEAPDFAKFLEKAVGSGLDVSGISSVSDTSSGCPGAEDVGNITQSGLTKDQAIRLVKNYGANRGGDSERTMGSSYWDACEGGGANCVSFSRFFINKFTGVTAPTPMGNGEAVVQNLGKAGVKTGSKPQLYAVFSWDNGGYGHTGVVLGMQGDQIIVGHASCSSGSPGEGDGVTLGKGAAIVRSGKISDPSVWLGTVPTEYAYPSGVDVGEIQKYIGGGSLEV